MYLIISYRISRTKPSSFSFSFEYKNESFFPITCFNLNNRAHFCSTSPVSILIQYHYKTFKFSRHFLTNFTSKTLISTEIEEMMSFSMCVQNKYIFWRKSVLEKSNNLFF